MTNTLFDCLPPEILQLIASNLHERERIMIGSVNREFCSIALKEMILYIEKVEKEISEEPPISKRSKMFMPYRRKLPRHVSIYYPKKNKEALLITLKSQILDSIMANSQHLQIKHARIERIIDRFIRERDGMRSSFLMAQLKLYGMKYRELESTCNYFEELMQMVLEGRTELSYGWMRYLRKTVLENIFNTFGYFYIKAFNRHDRHERRLQLLNSLTVFSCKTLDFVQDKLGKPLWNGRRLILENFFFGYWKVVPPRFDDYEKLVKLNSLVFPGGDLSTLFLEHLVEVDFKGECQIKSVAEVEQLCGLIQVFEKCSNLKRCFFTDKMPFGRALQMKGDTVDALLVAISKSQFLNENESELEKLRKILLEIKKSC